MPRYLLSFLFLFYFIFSFYVMFCFVLTSPPLMICVYLQTFEAALFWKKKKKKWYFELFSMFHLSFYYIYLLNPKNTFSCFVLNLLLINFCIF